MNRDIKVRYCFEEKAKILRLDSNKLKDYAKHFEERILQEIKEIERKKSLANEFTYQLHVS